MKEFSILNGYTVKDKTARERIEVLENATITPQLFGAAADGVTDDTAAIQAAIDTGKDVYFPEGTYLVTGAGLTVNTENQKIEFAGGAWIEAKGLTSDHALEVLSMYNKLYNVKIRLEDGTEAVNAIKLGGVVESNDDVEKTVESRWHSDNRSEIYLSETKIMNIYANIDPSILKLSYGTYQDYQIITPAFLEQNGYELVVEPLTAGQGISIYNTTGSYTEAKHTFTVSELISLGLSADAQVWISMKFGSECNIEINKAKAAVDSNAGFSCHLHEVVTTGTGLCGLQVSAAETRVIGGKFRGTKYGINVEAPDFYGSDIYCEQCTADGFRARSGSIEGHHIHSYNNANKGFSLAGINYSNFYGLYADKNMGDGVYMADNSGEVNVYGGWSFYSGNETNAAYDWNFSNVKDLNLFGCRSSGGDESKLGSYNVNANSRVYFYGCMANRAPNVKDGGIARFMNCGDKLKTYNTGSKSYKGEAQKIAAGATATIAISLDEILNNTHDIMTFDCVAQYRGTGTYTSGLAKHILQLSDHYANKVTPVVEDEKVTLYVGGVSFAENGATVATLNIVNNTTEELQVNITLTKMGSIY